MTSSLSISGALKSVFPSCPRCPNGSPFSWPCKWTGNLSPFSQHLFKERKKDIFLAIQSLDRSRTCHNTCFVVASNLLFFCGNGAKKEEAIISCNRDIHLWQTPLREKAGPLNELTLPWSAALAVVCERVVFQNCCCCCLPCFSHGGRTTRSQQPWETGKGWKEKRSIN